MPARWRRQTRRSYRSTSTSSVIMTIALLTSILILMATTISTNVTVSAQESNHFFCGATWDDASNNCDSRQHCPSGTDDECNGGGGAAASGTTTQTWTAATTWTAPSEWNGRQRQLQRSLQGTAIVSSASGGESDGSGGTTPLICFGGTLCDSTLGHGSKAKYASVPYEDISNTRFCGTDWNTAIEKCSIETHCPTGFSDECPSGSSCYGGLACNVQDFIEEEDTDAASTTVGGGGGGDETTKIDKNDPRRSNYCGKDWTDASTTCKTEHWCPDADDSLCPAGMSCFAETSCVYEEDLVPTTTPVVEPTVSPITSVMFDSPANYHFCGVSWAEAVKYCSLETHCPSGNSDDCPEGMSCVSVIAEEDRCNYYNLVANGGVATSSTPTGSPIKADDQRNNKFCGSGYDDASSKCSLATWCPNGSCPQEGETCYDYIPCNASEMTSAPIVATRNPTPIPTISPFVDIPSTISPAIKTSAPTITSIPTLPPALPADDIRHSYYCGKDWEDVNANCHSPCVSSLDTDCPDDLTCWANTDCRPAPPPTPTSSPSPTSTPTLTVSPAASSSSSTSSSTPVIFTRTPASESFVSFAEDESTTTYNSASSLSMSISMSMSMNESSPTTLEMDSSSNIPTKQKVVYPGFMDTLSQLSTMHPSTSLSRDSYPTDEIYETSTTAPTIYIDIITTDINYAVQQALPSSTTSSFPAPSPSTIATVGKVLAAAKLDISTNILIEIDIVTKEQSPTTLYQFDGFINALGVLSKGDVGPSYFYLGPNESETDEEDGSSSTSGSTYGLVNAALFLSQAAVEAVQFGVCDEVSWERDVYARYPLSNSCGQGGGKQTNIGSTISMAAAAPYIESNPCSEEEAFMACAVDGNMKAVAETQGIFTGAPPPLECYPRTSSDDDSASSTGAWDSTMGGINPKPSKNTFGREDVQGCCWWGRGPFPRGSAGTCMIGKLNYYLGARAFEERRTSARYMGVDFCRDPSAICKGHYEDDTTNAEIRWIMGMLYWINKVQAYYSSEDGWNYLEQLHQFVDGGMQDVTFVERVSRIVNRGCHDETVCGAPVSNIERLTSFENVISYLGLQKDSQEDEEVSSGVYDTRIPSMKPTVAPSLPGSIATASPTFSPETTQPSLREVTIEPSSGGRGVTFSPILPAEEYILPTIELKQRLNTANNYCASSLSEAVAECATSLRTCNSDDPPCNEGSCYGNVVCKVIWSDIAGPSPDESTEIRPPAENSIPTKLPTILQLPKPTTATANDSNAVAGAWWILEDTNCSTRHKNAVIQILSLLGASLL